MADDNDFEEFIDSIERGDFDKVKYFVKEKNFGKDHIYESDALQLAAKYGYLDIVKYLVEQGADVNWIDHDGSFALILSTKYGHFDVVKYLVEHGSDINEKDEISKK
jgi:ankyrin repeat protein